MCDNHVAELTNTIRTSRVARACRECPRPIPAGEAHRYVAGPDEEGGFLSYRAHVECFDLLQELGRQSNDGCFEYGGLRELARDALPEYAARLRAIFGEVFYGP